MNFLLGTVTVSNIGQNKNICAFSVSASYRVFIISVSLISVLWIALSSNSNIILSADESL